MSKRTAATAPHERVDDEQLRQDTAKQKEATDWATDPAIVARRFEELEKRQHATELELAKSQAALDAERRKQDESLPQRLAALEGAVALTNKPALRRGGGSGKIIVVEKGDRIAYHSRVNLGATPHGGWFKCSEDEVCSAERGITIIGIAKERKTYDEAFGIEMHKVKYQAYARLMRGCEHVVVGPPELRRDTTKSEPTYGGILTELPV